MRSNVVFNILTEEGTLSSATLYSPETCEILRRIEKLVNEENLEKIIFIYGQGEILSVSFPLSKEKAETVAQIVTGYIN